jgi:hypothetical protein
MPKKKPLNRDAFFLQLMFLLKAAQAPQRLPSPSQTVGATIAARSNSHAISSDFGDEYAPAGSRTRT